MKIEIETKYNVGDVLYHAGMHWDIAKVTVTDIEVCVPKDYPYYPIRVRYKTSQNEYVYEDNMFCHFDTPEEAGAYFAEKAIFEMKEIK